MIYYANDDWASLIFRVRGTVWAKIWGPVLFIFFYSIMFYIIQNGANVKFGSAGHYIIGSTMSYLLVFRANNANQRYWQGRSHMNNFVNDLRNFMLTTLIMLKGGAAQEAWRDHRASPEERARLEDRDDICASMGRVNVVRWALCVAIALKLHTRICTDGFVFGNLSGLSKWFVDFDRLRMRGLMTRTEFETINDLLPIHGEVHVTQGAKMLTSVFLDMAFRTIQEDEEIYTVDTTPDMRQVTAILFKLRLEIGRHVNEVWGIKERFVKDLSQLCHDANLYFELINQTMTTPIPFPYVHLCKVLLGTFLLSYPFFIDCALGWFANVFLPTAVATSLLGIDAIATELENPFGDDPNDLDLLDFIGQLEQESMMMLRLCGDDRALYAFMNRQMPPEVAAQSAKPLQTYLCLRSQVQSESQLSTPAQSREDLHRQGSGVKVHHVTFSQSDIFGETGERRPLLSPEADEEDGRGFVAMKEFGTETMIFHKADQDDADAKDNVGLSDDEGESPKKYKSRKSNEKSPTGSLQQQDYGFVPMTTFGTETVVFPEENRGSRDDAVDFIGLSDDSLGMGGASSSSKAKPKSAPRRGMDDSEDSGGFVAMEEFGADTVVFPEAGRASFDDALDVVGLSDDERSRSGGSAAFQKMDFGTGSAINMDFPEASASGGVDVVGLSHGERGDFGGSYYDEEEEADGRSEASGFQPMGGMMSGSVMMSQNLGGGDSKAARDRNRAARQ